MRARLLLAAATAVALAATGGAHGASKPTIDGKKIKKVELKASAGMQSHDQDLQDFLLGSDRSKCPAEECLKQEFVFKPYKGVSGDLVFKVTWSGSTNDIDLHLYENGVEDAVGQCGAAYGNTEWVSLKSSELKSGKTYTAVVFYYRTIPGSDITGTIEFPAKAPTAAGIHDLLSGCSA